MPQDFPGDYFMVLARCKQCFDVMIVESAPGFSWGLFMVLARCKQFFDVIDVESAPGFSWRLFNGTGQMQTMF